MNERNDIQVASELDAPVSESVVDDERLARRLDDCLRDDALTAALRQRARWTNVTLCVGIGAVERLVAVSSDAIVMLPPRPPLQPWDFGLRGTARAWHELWQPTPRSGWHDLFALAKRGEMRIEGNLQPFMANLQFFKDLVALPRAGRRP